MMTKKKVQRGKTSESDNVVNFKRRDSGTAASNSDIEIVISKDALMEKARAWFNGICLDPPPADDPVANAIVSQAVTDLIASLPRLTRAVTLAAMNFYVNVAMYSIPNRVRKMRPSQSALPIAPSDSEVLNRWRLEADYWVRQGIADGSGETQQLATRLRAGTIDAIAGLVADVLFPVNSGRTRSRTAADADAIRHQLMTAFPRIKAELVLRGAKHTKKDVEREMANRKWGPSLDSLSAGAISHILNPRRR